MYHVAKTSSFLFKMGKFKEEGGIALHPPFLRVPSLFPALSFVFLNDPVVRVFHTHTNTSSPPVACNFSVCSIPSP